MYRDLQNLTIICKLDHIQMVEYIKHNEKDYDLIKIVGSNQLNYEAFQGTFDEQFYKIFNVDFKKKYTDFKVVRDKDLELQIYNKFVTDKDYVFLHEDVSRNISINKNKINPNYNIIQPNENICNNIFSYLSIIENAKEVHCVDSCFLSLIDILNLNKNLYFHKYSRLEIYKTDRFHTSFAIPHIKNSWHVFEYN